VELTAGDRVVITTMGTDIFAADATNCGCTMSQLTDSSAISSDAGVSANGVLTLTLSSTVSAYIPFQIECTSNLSVNGGDGVTQTVKIRGTTSTGAVKVLESAFGGVTYTYSGAATQGSSTMKALTVYPNDYKATNTPTEIFLVQSSPIALSSGETLMITTTGREIFAGDGACSCTISTDVSVGSDGGNSINGVVTITLSDALPANVVSRIRCASNLAGNGDRGQTRSFAIKATDSSGGLKAAEAMYSGPRYTYSGASSSGAGPGPTQSPTMPPTPIPESDEEKRKRLAEEAEKAKEKADEEIKKIVGYSVAGASAVTATSAGAVGTALAVAAFVYTYKKWKPAFTYSSTGFEFGEDGITRRTFTTTGFEMPGTSALSISGLEMGQGRQNEQPGRLTYTSSGFEMG
jgi:hypothetical protein